MSASELERVIARWTAQAMSPGFTSSTGATPEVWVAQRVAEWLSNRAQVCVTEAESAIAGLRAELMKLGGWENQKLGGAMHELTHATDAISDVRGALELQPLGGRSANDA